MQRREYATQDEEIDAALERAQHCPELPRAFSANYAPQLDAIVVNLEGGRRLLLPRTELQGLENATEEQVAQIQIHSGVDISWPQLDVEHHIRSLAIGQYGSDKWMKELERRGIPDTPNNSDHSIARLKAAHVLYPLMGPFCSVEGQILHSVSEVYEYESLSKLVFRFESASLVVSAINANDTIAVQLHTTEHSGNDVSEEEPWRQFIGIAIGWCSLAMNQQGYLDGVLLAFSKLVFPEISITVAASGLTVRMVVPGSASRVGSKRFATTNN